jgi:protein required for attachment to host cells
MPTTWIVTGDAARARILQVTGRNQLEEVESFANPKGRMHDRDLETDAHPRLRGTSGPGNDREEMGAAEIEAEKFSKELGRYLDLARIKNRYDRLYLLAPPRFLGMMRKELGKEVQKLVRDDLDPGLKEAAQDNARAP